MSVRSLSLLVYPHSSEESPKYLEPLLEPRRSLISYLNFNHSSTSFERIGVVKWWSKISKAAPGYRAYDFSQLMAILLAFSSIFSIPQLLQYRVLTSHPRLTHEITSSRYRSSNASTLWRRLSETNCSEKNKHKNDGRRRENKPFPLSKLALIYPPIYFVSLQIVTLSRFVIAGARYMKKSEKLFMPNPTMTRS